jgi:hypothetical protein
MPRFSRLQAMVLFLVWETACHKRPVAVPVPPPPARNQPAPQTTAPAAASSEVPNPATTTHAQEPSPYQVNKPPPAPAARKPARSAATPAPGPAASPAPAESSPKLGDILSADQQKQYSASIDQSLSHAQASLNSIRERQLNKDQQAQLEQIRNFLQQAQATRGSDLAGAKSLAERAEVLARDLAASFH